jgi:hypothetical protein
LPRTTQDGNLDSSIHHNIIVIVPFIRFAFLLFSRDEYNKAMAAVVRADWSQVVALYFAIRCCLFVVVVVPVATLSAVVLLSKLPSIVLIALAATLAATRGMRRWIIKSAPTKQQANDAMQSTRIWVFPMGIFLASIVVMRPFSDVTIVKPMLTGSPALSFAVVIRLAIASVLLGLSVVSRFVGPPAVGT